MSAALIVAFPVSLLILLLWAWRDVHRARRREAIAGALAPRPEWRVRLLVDGLPALACFRVPAGYARTPAEAVAAVRVLRPRAVKRLPAGRWVAFPVIDEPGVPSGASGAEGRA